MVIKIIVIIIMSMIMMHIYCCKRDSCSDNLFDYNDSSDSYDSVIMMMMVIIMWCVNDVNGHRMVFIVNTMR